MLKFDVNPLLKSLEDFRVLNETKTKGMVQLFVRNVVTYATDSTPIGDSITHLELYKERTFNTEWQSYGLQPVEGFARGSWRVSLDGSTQLQENYGRDSGDLALRQARFNVRDYRLGQEVTISNYGPYISDLERNYSQQTQGQGIMKPTVDSVMRIASISLKNYYDKVTT